MEIKRRDDCIIENISDTEEGARILRNLAFCSSSIVDHRLPLAVNTGRVNNNNNITDRKGIARKYEINIM